MPDERFTHRKEGRSRKLSQLSDFEFRVLSQYRLSANDFGVMLYSPAPLISDNRVFEERTPAAIRKALDRMVELGLLLAFEEQGEWYVCSAEWQEYQTIRYPRETHWPIPSGAALEQCSAATRALFDVAGFRSANRRVRSRRRAEAARSYSQKSEKVSENVPHENRNFSPSGSLPLAVSRMPLAEDPPNPPRGGDGGNGFGPLRRHPLDTVDGVRPDAETCSRASAFLERFGAAHRRLVGEVYPRRDGRDFTPAKTLVAAYDDVKLDAMLELYMVATGPKFDGHPKSVGRFLDAAPMIGGRLAKVGVA
jgi:hypothetical protein